MENVIRLKPLVLDGQGGRNIYVVQQGTSSAKSIPPQVRRYLPLPLKAPNEYSEATPLSLASFSSDVLDKPPGDFVDMLYDNGFSIDGKVKMPFAMRMYPATAGLWRRGKLLVVPVNSDWIVDDYRVLGIFTGLPTINGKNVSELREAYYVVKDYRRLKERIKINPEGQYKFDFESDKPLLPDSVKVYKGIISRPDLVAILESTPTDSRGNRIVAGGKTNFVIASEALKDDELAVLIKEEQVKK